jgi:hypothetical protein
MINIERAVFAIHSSLAEISLILFKIPCNYCSNSLLRLTDLVNIWGLLKSSYFCVIGTIYFISGTSDLIST